MVDFRDAGFKANIGNYKGLMLCSRPNEEIRIEVERPFISRVDPKVPLGWNPVVQTVLQKPEKRVNYVLARHRQWLNLFKQKVRTRKAEQSEEEWKQQEKIFKLRETSLKKIGRRKNGGTLSQLQSQDNNSQQEMLDVSTVNRILNEPDSPQLAAYRNHEDNDQHSSPANHDDQNQDREVDDLLKFVGDLNYEQFIEDLEIKSMLGALKKRIDDINKSQEQIDNLAKKPQTDTAIKNNTNLKSTADVDTAEIRSHKSRASLYSMHSLKQDAEKIKKQLPDWDRSSTTGEKRTTIEDRLVKHIADEILKTNRYLRNVHSNSSIRKILEKEAKLHLQNTDLVQKIKNSQEQTNAALNGAK